MVIALKAEARKGTTKSERKGLRSNGKIPGVIYGSRIISKSIAIDEKQLLALLRSHPNAIVEMDVPELGKQSVMINEVQRDALSKHVVHVDFHQINMNEPVTATVRLDFHGDSIGVREGGILQIQHHEISIRCLPDDLPESIEVDISELEVGKNILVSELKVSSKLEIKTDEHDVLVSILAPQKAEEETEAEPADASGAAAAADAKAEDEK
ncbi:large subunit ribosomal protein L25 [Paenibacillus sp. 1_12]|uniref:50S ribosomal protein L25/general stress protein Ctc n=1 Tax=Paenibacillus sp. 1_12 TaxID=1566278 RepID=UPI0008EA4B6B|nr:50S ribosomal protein L25/general stress protein Ctc [Paenibacillus sp. 1_12]SFM31916.1 large subunit ribosomal protein L25 [Paenibacillus sp. 1_12]